MSNINSYFSQKDNLQKVILEYLDSAQVSVTVAVAWFTDTTLFRKLLEVQERGVNVQLIITNHQFNHDSGNNYHLVKENGGMFLQIGGDYKTMHHKFCIVDYKILLQGSFNWTRKANQSNNETLIVIQDDFQAINEFTEEFERLKRLSGLDKEIKELEIAKAIKYFTLIKTFIDLGKPNDIYPYLQEIKDVVELAQIVELLNNSEYERAILVMDEFQRNFTAIVNVSHYEKEELIFKIKLISEQIRQLEIEKTSIEEVIETFNRRYILELNPILANILELKKKIYEKFEVLDETFEELKSQYQSVNEELELEQEKEVPELSDYEKKDIKKMYYEASSLCHPDSSNCVIEDKTKAQELFSALSSAYKEKDIETVKRIWEELKLGIFNPENLNNTEMDKLRRKLAVLENKFNMILNSLRTMKITEPYITISQVKDWDEFFEIQKNLLLSQKEELELKYIKP
jgi:phosphatidylserine/phosphatidylglycerophosphate/cardiolipin synthase-like enzyme